MAPEDGEKLQEMAHRFDCLTFVVTVLYIYGDCLTYIVTALHIWCDLPDSLALEPSAITARPRKIDGCVGLVVAVNSNESTTFRGGGLTSSIVTALHLS